MSKAEEQIRNALHKRKLKTFYDLKEDGSNLDEILEEYNKIAKASKTLIEIEGKTLGYALNQQPKDFNFFIECRTNVKSILDYYEAYLKHTHSALYKEIRSVTSRDMTEKEINSLIHDNPTYHNLLFEVLKVRDVHDKFIGIMEAYKQRGFTLNNITKSIEFESQNVIL